MDYRDNLDSTPTCRAITESQLAPPRRVSSDAPTRNPAFTHLACGQKLGGKRFTMPRFGTSIFSDCDGKFAA